MSEWIIEHVAGEYVDALAESIRPQVLRRDRTHTSAWRRKESSCRTKTRGEGSYLRHSLSI